VRDNLLGEAPATTLADGTLVFSRRMAAGLSDAQLIDLMTRQILVRFARTLTHSPDWNNPNLADYLLRRVKQMRRR
jgi:hypothetical protein